jgi:hypothetical protein
VLSEGTPAPDFELQGWRLSKALSNSPILLVFFKIACPTCQFTLPFLPPFGPTELEVVPISQDNDASTAEFLNRFAPGLKALTDKAWDFAVSNLYRIEFVPSLFLVEPNGKISLAVHGFSQAAIQHLAERFTADPFAGRQGIPALKPG